MNFHRFFFSFLALALTASASCDLAQDHFLNALISELLAACNLMIAIDDWPHSKSKP